MFMNPAITTAVAEQHRRDLITQAGAYRLARAARNCRPTQPGRSSRPRRLTGLAQAFRRAVTAGAAAVAVAVFMMTPAGAATTHHVFAEHGYSHRADSHRAFSHRASVHHVGVHYRSRSW
jgi:hypothetical protein